MITLKRLPLQLGYCRKCRALIFFNDFNPVEKQLDYLINGICILVRGVEFQATERVLLWAALKGFQESAIITSRDVLRQTSSIKIQKSKSNRTLTKNHHCRSNYLCLEQKNQPLQGRIHDVKSVTQQVSGSGINGLGIHKPTGFFLAIYAYFSV